MFGVMVCVSGSSSRVYKAMLKVGQSLVGVDQSGRLSKALELGTFIPEIPKNEDGVVKAIGEG